MLQVDRCSDGIGCVRIVLENGIDTTTKFPACEDIFDSIGGLFPLEVCLGDQLEKGKSIFSLFSTFCCKAAWSDRE